MSRRPDRQQILAMISGFRPACVIGAAAELDLWTVLGDQAMGAQVITQRIGGNPRAMTMLLDAVVALGLLEKHDGAYSVPIELRNWLTAKGDGTIFPMLQHNMTILRGWSQLSWTALAGIPAPRPASIRGPAADRAAFVAAMHSVSGPIADDLVRRLGPPACKHVLDVGGASGTWTLAFLRNVPASTATIFDLPDAVQQAQSRIAGTLFASRIKLVPGDFYADDLPPDADYAWVSAICHQHSREHNRELFVKVFKALLPGGKIGVRDFVMATDRTQPPDGALFAINMLVNTATGGTYTFEEYSEDLRVAGFVDPVLRIKSEDMNSVVEAAKPARR